ncbi:MAG: hypothetical protein LJE62_16175 [Silicimonas sp.]|nr:hypothetical protein [Silicimonas sp.]
MRNNIRVFGMRRSGNHAVIAWLRRNIGAKSIFLNDCQAGDPFASFQYIELAERRFGTRLRRDGARTARDRAGKLGDSAVVVSYEDQPPPNSLRGWRRLTTGLDPKITWSNVLIWRSTPNWLASFVPLVMSDKTPRHLGCRGPLEIAQFVVLQGEMLSRKDADTCIPIHYDRWLSDADYRREALDLLGAQCIDNSLGDVSNYGGGSSHGDETVDPKRLQARWQSVRDEPLYQAIVRFALSDEWFMSIAERAEPGVTDIMQSIVDR